MNSLSFPLRRAAVPLAVLLLVLSHSASLAAQPPCVTGLGTRVIALGGPVTVRILAPGADFTSEIFVVKPATVGEFRFPLGSSQDVGASVSAGTFTAGSELRFLIDVDQTGYEFTTGPASRNLDALAHARVTQVDADTVRVGFEDFLGESDRDFDDVIFEVDGAHPQIYFAGLPATPGDRSKLACDPAGDLVASPIQLGGSIETEISLGSADGWGSTFTLRSAPGAGSFQALARGTDGLARSSVRGHASAGGSSFKAGFKASSDDLLIDVELLKDGVSLGHSQVPGAPADGLLYTSDVELPCPWNQMIDPGGISMEQECHFDEGPYDYCVDKVVCVDRDDGFDEVRFTFVDPNPVSRSPIGSVELSADALDEWTFGSQSLFRFGQRHTALGQTEFHPTADSLALSELGTSGNDGVSIDLGSGVETFESIWKPLPLVGLSVAGSQIALASRGRFEGEEDRDLGTLRLLQVDGKVRVEADYTSVGSATHRILVLDHGTVVADVRSHAGIVAHMTSWPSGAGKGSFTLPDLTRTPCYSLPLPPDTWIDVPNGPKVLGDRVLVLAESAGSVGAVSRFDLRASRLPDIAIADEQVTLEPIPPVPAACVPSAGRLCLGDGKFAAEVTWRDAAGNLRASEAVPLTREAGYFRFTDPARPEVAVKLFDGRAINGHWWVYEGGLSRRAYRLTVIDLERGTRKVYDHPKGRFASRVDERAFAASGEERSTSRLLDLGTGEISVAAGGRAGACSPAATRLCLAEGRFEVEVVSRGGVGVPRTTASTVPLGDAAGYFFFSEAASADVFVKALPKREGGWAIVRGSLTRSAYELRVRDRATGEVRILR